MADKVDLKNVVLVSNKPIARYLFAIAKVLESYKEVILKARGKNISYLVNLAEISKRNGLKVKSMQTGTEILKTEERDISVSTIEIILIK